jgi:DNA polymerase III delta prime subunit
MHAFVISIQYSVLNTQDTLVIEPDKSIGIDEIKTISFFLSRKPLGDKNRVYVQQAHLMTLPAQNAILKILEEPPENSEIYLLTKQPEMLLPTVLSRCQIATGLQNPHSLKPINPEGYNLESITTRQEALVFLDGVEMYLHQNLQAKINYEKLTDCRRYLKANVNLKLCLDYLSFNLLSY